MPRPRTGTATTTGPDGKGLSGGARLKAKGLRSITLAVTQDDHETLRKGAEAVRTTMSQLLISSGLRTARKNLKENT